MATGIKLSMAILLLLAADPWTESLTFRAAHEFEQELRACTTAIEQGNRRSAVCKRRVEALDRRRDTDGKFGCLRELSVVRTEYRTLKSTESWQRVSELLTQERCSDVLKADSLVWLRREALKRNIEHQGVDLPVNFSREQLETNQIVELADLQMELLAGIGAFEEAYRLEEEMNLARSQRASESLYLEHYQAIVRRISWWARGLLIGFAVFAIPATVAVVRRNGFGRWGGLRYSLSIVGLFGVLACLKEPSQISLWLTLGFGAVGIQWLTAYAAHIKEGWKTMVSIVGAVTTVAAFWEILIWYGETSWVY